MGCVFQNNCICHPYGFNAKRLRGLKQQCNYLILININNNININIKYIGQLCYFKRLITLDILANILKTSTFSKSVKRNKIPKDYKTNCELLNRKSKVSIEQREKNNQRLVFSETGRAVKKISLNGSLILSP